MGIPAIKDDSSPINKEVGKGFPHSYIFIVASSIHLDLGLLHPGYLLLSHHLPYKSKAKTILYIVSIRGI